MPSDPTDTAMDSDRIGVVPPREQLVPKAVAETLEKEGEAGEDAAAALVKALRALLDYSSEIRSALLGGFRYETPTGDDARKLSRHPWDDRAATALEGLGQEGTTLRAEAMKAADAWRAKGSTEWAVHLEQLPLPAMPFDVGERWLAWADGLTWKGRFARTLARALWLGEVKAAVEAERAKQPRKPAMLASVVIGDLQTTFWNPRNDVRLRDTGDGRASVEIVSPGGEVLASTPVLEAAEVELAQRGYGALGSYPGQRILRAIPAEAWRKQVGGDRNPRVLAWPGGIDTFLDWLQLSKKNHALVLGVLRAGQDFRRTWGDNGRPSREIGGLWSYDLDSGWRGDRRGYLEVNVNRPLAAFFVRNELRRGDDRNLTPLLPMPPGVGSPNKWGGQARFQFVLGKRLMEDRVQVAEEGGALLVAEELARIADGVGMDLGDVARVMDRWTHEGDDGPAVLERLTSDRDRYHLADNALYRQARAYITERGKVSLAKARRSRRGLARKARP